MTLLTV